MTKGPDRNSGLHLGDTRGVAVTGQIPHINDETKSEQEQKYDSNETLPHQVKTECGYETFSTKPVHSICISTGPRLISSFLIIGPGYI